MSIVSNTGPLIALAKVDALGLLTALFGAVHISPAVQRELLGKTGVEADRLDQALNSDWLTVAARPELSAPMEILLRSIDAGERESIALAQKLALPLIIDDRLGRAAARQLGVSVTGTVGVLIEAKRSGQLAAIRPMLEVMRTEGYWLSDELMALALRLASE
jgi:predicted nucleic acid-binding protein